MPTTEGSPVNFTAQNVRVIYEGVGELSNDDLRGVEIVTSSWYTEFFAERESARRRRNLQTTVAVKDMETTIEVTGQDASNGANTVTYTQKISYIALDGALPPIQYITLPFRNDMANVDYGTSLRLNMTAFERILLPIEEPTVGKAPPENEDNDGGDDGLSAGAIAGIAIAGAVGAGIVAIGGYRFMEGKDVKRRRSSAVKEAAAAASPKQETSRSAAGASTSQKPAKNKGSKAAATSAAGKKDSAASVSSYAGRR
jgi:hypothetical protein